MSKVVAQLNDEELSIEKVRQRQTEKDIFTVSLLELKYNKEYRCKIKLSNKEQYSKILLLEEVPYEKFTEIKLKKELLANGEDITNLDNISLNNDDAVNTDDDNLDSMDDQDNTEDLSNAENAELEIIKKSGVIVFTKGAYVYYCYGRLETIYKRMVHLQSSAVKLTLNKKGLSVFMFAYFTNKYNLKIGKKTFALNDSIQADIDIGESPKKLGRRKLYLSKNRFSVKFGKEQLLNDDNKINNTMKIITEINGEPVAFKIAVKKKKVKNKKYYYAPIKSTYIDDFAFHIRRTPMANLIWVKRLKEPIEDSLQFRFLESTIISFLMYHVGKLLTKLRRKKINIFYEKFAEKSEEGVFELCQECSKSKKTKNYFVIDKTKPDYDKIKNSKNVVKKYSLKYYWLIYNANTFIASEVPGHLNVLRSNNKYFRRATYDKQFVFLQHGIIYMKNLGKKSVFVSGKEGSCNYIVVSSEKESDIVSDMLKYNEQQILRTGLAMYGKLDYKHINQNSDDVVTVMLTWKTYEEHLYNFEESSYYQNVVEMYNMLSKYIDKDNIIILSHPKATDQLMNTNLKDSLWSGSVSEALEKTKFLITDYSSVCYNSFYQGSGVVFYQPDLELFEKENGLLIPNEDEYIGKRAFNIEELEEIVSDSIQNKKINLDKLRTKEHEEVYKTINEFSDGKNIERIFNNLQKLNIV